MSDKDLASRLQTVRLLTGFTGANLIIVCSLMCPELTNLFFSVGLGWLLWLAVLAWLETRERV